MCLTALRQRLKPASQVTTSVAAGLSASIPCSEETVGRSPAGVHQRNDNDCSGAVQTNTNGSARLIKETGRLPKGSFFFFPDHNCAFPLTHYPYKAEQLPQTVSHRVFSQNYTTSTIFSCCFHVYLLRWLNPLPPTPIPLLVLSLSEVTLHGTNSFKSPLSCSKMNLL